MEKAIKKANEDAKDDEKLPRLTIHSLRHSGASIHLMRGTPLPEVSAMLGHANAQYYADRLCPFHTQDADSLSSNTIRRDF